MSRSSDRGGPDDVWERRHGRVEALAEAQRTGRAVRELRDLAALSALVPRWLAAQSARPASALSTSLLASASTALVVLTWVTRRDHAVSPLTVPVRATDARTRVADR